MRDDDQTRKSLRMKRLPSPKGTKYYINGEMLFMWQVYNAMSPRLSVTLLSKSGHDCDRQILKWWYQTQSRRYRTFPPT